MAFDDGIAETGSVCTSTDALHFQNSEWGDCPYGSGKHVGGDDLDGGYTGLGVNGTAGVKSTAGPTGEWPVILGGEGGPVAIDPTNAANWYVNNAAGVSIHLCSSTDACTPLEFGTSAAVTNADVSGDGNTMVLPAPFIVDPLDPTQLLIGTCRVWRGPADGGNWNGANAISAMLDKVAGNSYCSGDALIRTLAALPLEGGGEIIYVGMYGATDGGSILAGHVLSATFLPGGSSNPTWNDLTLNPVTNDQRQMNYYALDVSSIFIDPHDSSGNTYATIAGFSDPLHAVRVAYRSTDGGAHWVVITSNLPSSPANSIVIDPMDANTAYLATDNGVYSTRQIATCGPGGVELLVFVLNGLAARAGGAVECRSGERVVERALVAATYGRGVWADSALDRWNTTDDGNSFGAQI